MFLTFMSALKRFVIFLSAFDDAQTHKTIAPLEAPGVATLK